MNGVDAANNEKKTGKLLRGFKFLVSHGYSVETKYNFSLLALKELFQKYRTVAVGLIVENKLAHYKIQTLSVTLAPVDILAHSPLNFLFLKGTGSWLEL